MNIADKNMKIAILLLNNYGDILYATPIAKQIKEIDFPESNLTWIVSKQCKDILIGNPFVNQLEVVELENVNQIYSGKWKEIKNKYVEKLEKGEYDKLFILQPFDLNFLYYSNCIRGMILKAYPFKIITSLSPLLYLSQKEINNVTNFIDNNKINIFKNKILLEFAASSGQSKFKPNDAVILAEMIVQNSSSTCVIISSHLDIPIKDKRIFNAKTLSFKENAELINHCTLLVGCSSGISWMSTSAYCKPIPKIQFLNTNVRWFNSLKADFIANNIDTSNLLELYEFNLNDIAGAVSYAVNNTFANAKIKYDQILKNAYLQNNYKTIATYFYQQKSLKFSFIFFIKNMDKGKNVLKYNFKLLLKIILSR